MITNDRSNQPNNQQRLSDRILAYTHKQITETPSLDKAIAIARTRIRNTNIAIGPLQPIGFLIYDASGSQLFHREYPVMK